MVSLKKNMLSKCGKLFFKRAKQIIFVNKRKKGKRKECYTV